MNQALVDVAEAVEEKRRRVEENGILFYKPCCRAHENKCPVLPCPDSKHAAFHMSTARTRIILGGNRSSKTFTSVAEMILSSCFKTHPIRKTPNPFPGQFRMFESDFGVMEKLLLPLVLKLIPKDALAEAGNSKQEAWEKSYDSKYHILHLKGGTTIDFMSYDQDLSKVESVELDGVFADEEMPEDMYNGTTARLVSRRGKFWMAVTPLYRFSWGMKFLETTDPNVQVFRFEIYDNPYMSKEAVKEFENSITNPLEKEARLFGRFMELQGLVYKELRQEIHRIASDKPKPGYPVIFALDPHPRKPSVMTWSYLTPKDDVVFFDELEMAGTARDIASAIRAKEATHPARTMMRIIDPAAKAQGSNIAYETDTIREFDKEGIHFTLADNSEAGYNVVHEYLTYNPAFPLSALNRPRCFFTADVPKTWYGMTHLMWDEWQARSSLRDKKEGIKDYKKDFPDCVRYTLARRPSFRSLAGAASMARPMGNWIEFSAGIRAA